MHLLVFFSSKMCCTLSSRVVSRTKLYSKCFEEEIGRRKRQIDRKLHDKGLRVSNRQNKVASHDGWGEGGMFFKVQECLNIMGTKSPWSKFWIHPWKDEVQEEHVWLKSSWWKIKTPTTKSSFLHIIDRDLKHMWGKLCGFIHYNVQHVIFIVTYITLELQLTLWQQLCHNKHPHMVHDNGWMKLQSLSHMCDEPQPIVWEKSYSIITKLLQLH